MRLSMRLSMRLGIMQLLCILSLIASGTVIPPAAADEEKSLEPLILEALTSRAHSLSQTISNSHYEVSLDPLPALLLSPCDTKPNITFLTGAEAGSQRMKIECSAPARWSLYARGHISLKVPVVVARRTLDRGSTIRNSDVTLQEMDISTLRRGYLLDTESFASQQLSRRIRAGDVITPQSLQAAHLIRRGDRIAIIAGNDSFTISMPGEALENGRLNQQIRVRNLSSGKTIRGTVSGTTEVRVL